MSYVNTCRYPGHELLQIKIYLRLVTHKTSGPESRVCTTDDYFNTNSSITVEAHFLACHYCRVDVSNIKLHVKVCLSSFYTMLLSAAFTIWRHASKIAYFLFKFGVKFDIRIATYCVHLFGVLLSNADVLFSVVIFSCWSLTRKLNPPLVSNDRHQQLIVSMNQYWLFVNEKYI